MNPPQQAAAEASTGSFAPLRQRLFAVLWVATVLGNTGSFMRDVASSWLVAELSRSAVVVSLMQVAASLPVFLLAVPAGVLTDVLDKRRLLIVIQVGLACVSALLMLMAATDSLSVASLVGLTFVGGMGAALVGPTWQSIVPELVPRAELKNAVALNSLGFNISRSIGPAIGGLILASLGAAATYGADVLSYLFVIAALIWWPRSPAAPDALSENFGGALRAGLRYARASRDFHRVLVRAALFFAFASAVWGLLPLIARDLLGGTPGFYGVLLGAVGAGAIVGALILPRLRRRFDADDLLLGASILAGACMASLAAGPPQWAAPVILLALGTAWIAALTTLNGMAQAILPNWVRGRGLAIYLTVFNGAMALGSVAWGTLTDWTGLATTLLVASVGLIVVGFAARAVKLPTGDADLAPSNHWPEPLLAAPVANDRGPVLITIEYRIPPDNRVPFLTALDRLAEQRRRDGAYRWGVTEDAADPERIVEWFMVESWAEHLRQHRRVSIADVDVQEEARRFHIGSDPPQVRHLLGLFVTPSAHRGQSSVGA